MFPLLSKVVEERMLDPEKLVDDLWKIYWMVKDEKPADTITSALYGLIDEAKRLPPRYATRGEKKEAVLEALAADPFQSSRKLAGKLGVSHVFVARCRRPMPEIAGRGRRKRPPRMRAHSRDGVE